MNVPIACAIEGCENEAGPEGFCLTDHVEEANAARRVTERTIQMQREVDELAALHKAARRIVQAEKRAIKQKAVKAKKARRRIAAASKARNR